MTIVEIAKLAGVSTATVSKIVNGKDISIHPSTRERVLKIVKEYNYTPYGSVRLQAGAKTFLLGILLRDAAASRGILSGILKEAGSHGYGTVVFDSAGDPGSELKHITSLIRHRVDGVIWIPVCAKSTENEHFFPDQGIPVIRLDPEGPADADPPESAAHSLPALRIDHEKIGYLLAQELIKARHKNIVCVGRRGDPALQPVAAGVRKCLFDHQLPREPELITFPAGSAASSPEDRNAQDSLRSGSGETDLTAGISRIFSSGATGVVSADPDLAGDLLDTLGLLRFSVPEDLSIVTVKREEAPEPGHFAFPPRISGISVPLTELGQAAALRLIAQCEKKDSETCASGLFSYPFDHRKSVALPSEFRTKKLVIVGSIHMDTTFHTEALPKPGETIRILSSASGLGGKGANQAVGAARLGARSVLIGKTGNDADSFRIFELLKKEHVSTAGISRCGSMPTGSAYIYLDPDGESAITIHSGANAALTPADIRAAGHIFRGAQYCLLSGELPLPAVTEAAETARENGCSVILKPSAMSGIPDELIRNTDFLIPNRSEAARLCPDAAAPGEQAGFFLSRGAGAVIITLDREGCYLRTAETARFFPAADFPAVDTTGGADAFISAFAVSLCSGLPLETAVRAATYAAGVCISGQGVVSALADRDTLEAYVSRS